MQVKRSDDADFIYFTREKRVESSRSDEKGRKEEKRKNDADAITRFFPLSLSLFLSSYCWLA